MEYISFVLFGTCEVSLFYNIKGLFGSLMFHCVLHVILCTKSIILNGDVQESDNQQTQMRVEIEKGGIS